MTSRDELEKALLCEPTTSDLWRVFGDLLEQNGDARGSLIAIEHELAKDGERPDLVRERDHIQKTRRASWLEGLGSAIETGELTVRLQFGFVAAARATTMRSALLVLRHPSSRFLRALSLRSSSPLEIGLLLDVLPSTAVIDLDLAECALRRSEVRMIATSPTTERLSSLGLAGNRLGDWGVTDFERASRFHALERLDLSSTGVGDRGIQWVAKCPSLSSLETLRLVHSSFTEVGAEALAGAKALTRLSALDLGSVPIGPAGVAHLAASPHLASLVALDVRSCGELGSDGVRALLGGRFHLESLNVSGTALQDEGAEALARHPGSARLRELVASRNEIGTSGALALAESPHLSNLVRLDLYDNPIGDTALIAILERLEHLTDLLIAPRHVGDSGVAAIDRSRLSTSSKEWFHLERERWLLYRR